MADLISWRSLKKLVVIVIGPLLVLLGVLLLVLPGPGILLMIAGIALLGTEYHWARRLMGPVKQWLERNKRPKPADPEPKPPAQD